MLKRIAQKVVVAILLMIPMLNIACVDSGSDASASIQTDPECFVCDLATGKCWFDNGKKSLFKETKK